MIKLKTHEEVVSLRKGGRILARILDELSLLVAPGVSTEELNDEALEKIERAGAEPVLLGYHPEFAPRPYPAAICTSINDVVVHGIPNEPSVVLQEGDVVGIDLSIGYEGMIVDSARTVPVGLVNPEVQKLINITKEALAVGIKAAKAGGHVGDIGAAIESFVRPHHYGIVEELCGHGVGYAVHEEPMVQNVGTRGTGPELEPGLVLAIEPMLTLGDYNVTFDKKDGYTVRTKDGSVSAHFEHTIVITENGPEILTASR
ncbi:type I methionyl aminopeptidase [Candidatus Kaiserbacteria bacterium]|nr:type I methionyl aminopeptidase [Candidatus Kaiserbacteria bacterium]